MAKGRRSSLKEAPDGGYGWVVLVACAVGLGMVISTGRIGGQVFVEIINVYKVSRTEAMTVLIVGRMFAFIAAPVAGKLLTMYDFSVILSLGGLIMSTALILSSFTTAAWQLIITYGCILGTGSDFILVSSTLVVGIYFKKRRSLAMGMLYAIGCSGGFIMPVLFNVLLEVYQFNGTLLIVGAIILNSAACGLLVRQPTWTNKGTSAVKDYEFRPAITNSNENLYQPGASIEFKSKPLLVERNPSRISFDTVEEKEVADDPDMPFLVARSQSQISSGTTEEKTTADNPNRPYLAQRSQSRISWGTAEEKTSADELNKPLLVPRNQTQISSGTAEEIKASDDANGPFPVQRSLSQISSDAVEVKMAAELDGKTGMQDQREERNGIMETGVFLGSQPSVKEVKPKTCVPEIRVELNERPNKNGMLEMEPFLTGPAEPLSNKKRHPNPIGSLFAQFIDSLKIFRDYLFIEMFINRVLVMACLLNFNPIIPDYIDKDVEANISKQEVAFILSMMAVGDVIGRLAIGTTLDKLPWPKKHTFGALTVVVGVVMFSLHWATTYVSLLAISVVYGFLMGSCVIVQYVLEVDLMGASRAPVAHTISQFSIGIAATVGGFLIGYMRDSMGSYAQSINLIAGVSIASGLIWVLEPVLSKFLPPPPAPLVKSVTSASIIEPEEPHI